ncbi:unnamed protein product, partial [Vitis vinifera]
MLKSFPPKSRRIYAKHSSFISRPLSSSPSSSSSDSSPSSLPNSILTCRTANQALELFHSVSRRADLAKNPQLYSAIIHVLTGAKLYAKARCLMRDLIQCLQNSRRSRICCSVFNVLSRLESSKFTPNVFGVLIIAFSEMGLVEEALWVYYKMDVLPAMQACNMVLDGLVKKGRFDTMWKVYGDMVARGASPNVVTYGTLIDGCCRQGDFLKAFRLFDEMIEKKIFPTVVIYTILIRGLCGESRISEAESMFRTMRNSGMLPNLYTYNTMMDGYCKIAHVKKALELYQEMLGDGLLPNVVTFGILIDGLCKTDEMVSARKFLIDMASFGVVPNIFVYNCLIDGYCKAGNLSEALSLHSEIEKHEILPDVFTYSILIKGLCGVDRMEEADGLLQEMKKKGFLPNAVTYNTLIDGYCKEGNMEKAIEVCSQMTEKGIEPNIITFSTLIDGYCKAGKMEAAMGLYTEMVIKGLLPDVVAYTALIDGHFKDGNTKEAFRLHKEMQEAGLHPNVFTLSCLIDGLCKDGRISDAIKLFLAKTGTDTTGSKTNELDRSLYQMCSLALSLFRGISEPCICVIRVTKLFATNNQPKAHLHTHLKPPKSNQTLKRYLQSSNTSKVLLFFRILLRKNPSSIDSFSLMFALKACTLKSSLVEGKQMHALVINFGFEPIIFLQTSLISMYSATGNVADAHNMFDEIPSKNLISWTSVISAYVDNQRPNKALQLFRQMQMDDVQPDIVTVTVALSACADLGALDMGEWIHAYIRHRGLDTDLCLNNSLINMYSKCGEIGTARRFSLVLPNDVTFMGVLMACSHAGLVEEGKQHFRSMKEDYSLRPRISHFGCMVDLLCRAGLLTEAYEFILKMPVRPNAVVWRTLLGACSLQGMWDKKMLVRNQIKQRRDPGCSSIEVGIDIKEFVAADDQHPCMPQIYEILDHLTRTMRASDCALGTDTPME